MDLTRAHSRRKFLSTASAAAIGAALIPRAARALGTTIPDQIRRPAQPFPMENVRLLDGPFKTAMEVNFRYLTSLPNDRLLHNFRVNAGLSSTATPFGGWEAPTCELRGHFTGGHFLSAMALGYAATGDDVLKAKGDVLVAQLASCQQTLRQGGYLSAFPQEEFDRLRTGAKVWAPFYTFHKIMAGHLDMYAHCGNAQALDTARSMGDWVVQWLKGTSDAMMARIMQYEFGGMNEVLYNLYAITSDERYMDVAHRFDQPQFMDPLAAFRDELQGMHVNTNIPKVIGAARRYELTDEGRYRDIAEYFWNEVTAHRAYCTGGTGSGEWWNTPPGVFTDQLTQWDEECCCGYNMLKLTRHIFGWTGDARAMDYYERTLYNSRLGTQHPGNGLKMYFLPLGSGYWKYFNSADNTFWCCTGTGAEEFSKFNDTIYFHDDDTLYVNLFIASELQWPQQGLRLRQETRFPEQEGSALRMSLARPARFRVAVRVPYWATRGGSIAVNGQPLDAFAEPSSYLTIDRVWHDGDRVNVDLPMSLHIDALPGDPTRQAVMYGPLVLAGRLGAYDLTHLMTYASGDATSPSDTKAAQVPTIRTTSLDELNWVEPTNERLSFRTRGQSSSVVLVPLNALFDEFYNVYWSVAAPS
jgi:uncharacterized protein